MIAPNGPTPLPLATPDAVKSSKETSAARAGTRSFKAVYKRTRTSPGRSTDAAKEVGASCPLHAVRADAIAAFDHGRGHAASHSPPNADADTAIHEAQTGAANSSDTLTGPTTEATAAALVAVAGSVPIVPERDRSVHIQLAANTTAAETGTPVSAPNKIASGGHMAPRSGQSAGAGVSTASLSSRVPARAAAPRVGSGGVTPGTAAVDQASSEQGEAESAASSDLVTPAVHTTGQQTIAAGNAKLGGIERMQIVREAPEGLTAARERTAIISDSTRPVTSAATSSTPAEAVTPRSGTVAVASADTPLQTPADTAVTAHGQAPLQVVQATIAGAHLATEVTPIQDSGSLLLSPALQAAMPVISEESSTDENEDAPTRDDVGNSPRDGTGSSADTASVTADAVSVNGIAPHDAAASPVTVSTSAAVAQNTDRAQVAQQISRHIESMRLTSGHSEMTLNLTPDHLGALRLTITSTEHGVTAHFAVQTAQAHQAVAAAKEELRSALEQRGLNLTSLDVSVSQQSADGGAFAQQQARERQSNGRTWRGSAGHAEVLPPAAAIPSPAEFGDNGARIDYRA